MSLEALAASFAPGERLYLPGAGGEHPGFTAALSADPALTRGLEITANFVPGINPLPLERWAPDVRVRSLFMQPGAEAARADGRLRLLPTTYAGYVRELRARERFDAAVVHVAPPDAQGRCSLGVAVELTLLAAARCARLLAVVNPQMPALPGAPTLPLDGFHAVAWAAAPLRLYDPGPPDASARALAAAVASVIPDGATLQLGVGKAPAAVCEALAGRRDLRFWSGLASDGLLALAEAGALAEAPAVAAAAVGSEGFAARLVRRGDRLQLVGCEVTHDPARLAALPRLHAVQAALEVDLLGQANLEEAGGRLVSSPGGAPDFARAAARGEGASIVALPALAGREGRSRLVPRLTGAVTLARHEVDVVATEHGAADLRGLDVEARARAIAAVAAPQHREPLLRAWRDGARQLEAAA